MFQKNGKHWTVAEVVEDVLDSGASLWNNLQQAERAVASEAYRVRKALGD